MSEQHQPPEQYTVARMQPEEVEAMLELHSKVWLDTFANEKFNPDPAEVEKHQKGPSQEKIDSIRRATLEPIDTASKAWFVAKSADGEVVGFTRPWRADEDGLQRVGAIYVDPDHQGSGIADQLMDQVISWSDPARPLCLWVAAENGRAQGFYHRRGFETVEGKQKVIYGSVPHIQMVRKGDLENEV